MLSTYSRIIQQNHSLPQIEFSALDLSSLPISVINQIPTKLMFISELNLDNNLLVSLTGIEQFMNLEVLTFNFNFISEKTHLLQIKNKFLLKELSFVGNQIEATVTLDWLQKEDFTALQKINQVQRIGHIAKERSQSYQRRNETRPENHTFYRDHSFSHEQNFQQKAQIILNSSKSKHFAPFQQQDNETKRIHNESIENSYFLPFVRANMTNRLTKNKERFDSTGDTRKQKRSFNQFNETSRYSNSFESSPNFNNFRQSLLKKQNNEYLSSTRKKNISEFRLYPVDEQMNRSRKIEQEVNLQNDKNWTQEELYVSEYRSRRIRPFEEMEEKPYQSYSKQLQNNYRSDYYHLDRGAKMKTRSDHSDNNIIQREIPVYKQAIAIAFYYRNLLEKVFTAFGLVIHSRQNTQRLTSQNHEHRTPKNNIFSNSSQNSPIKQESDHEISSPELRLKRYAWMKLELFTNHNKIIEKYTQSLVSH